MGTSSFTICSAHKFILRELCVCTLAVKAEGKVVLQNLKILAFHKRVFLNCSYKNSYKSRVPSTENLRFNVFFLC